MKFTTIVLILGIMPACKSRLQEIYHEDSGSAVSRTGSSGPAWQQPAPARELTREEIDHRLYTLIHQTKLELGQFKARQGNGDGMDDNMKGIMQLADSTLTHPDEKIFNFITSKDYYDYHQDSKKAEAQTRVVDEQTAYEESESSGGGFYLTESKDDSEKTESEPSTPNDKGATWLIVTGVLNIVTLVGIGQIVVGATLKEQGKDADDELVQAGKVLNIVSGTAWSVAGATVGLGSLFYAATARNTSVGKKLAVGGIGAAVGAGIMAMGIHQIMAGAEMGLAEGTANDNAQTLATLGIISDEIHELIEKRPLSR